MSLSARPAPRLILFAVFAATLAVLPPTGLVYPYFIMQAMCFALFASAFNLLIGYAGCSPSATRCFLALAAMSPRIWRRPAS